jgi:monoamine oxidase
VSAERHDVIVVGAGIAGLAAAWELRDRDVLVLEREDRIGGRIWSERRGDHWLNFGAHVFGLPESATGRLLADAGVRAVQVSGRLTAGSLNGKIVARAARWRRSRSACRCPFAHGSRSLARERSFAVPCGSTR